MFWGLAMLKRSFSLFGLVGINRKKKPQLYDTDKRFKLSFDYIGKISKTGKSQTLTTLSQSPPKSWRQTTPNSLWHRLPTLGAKISRAFAFKLWEQRNWKNRNKTSKSKKKGTKRNSHRTNQTVSISVRLGNLSQEVENSARKKYAMVLYRTSPGREQFLSVCKMNQWVTRFHFWISGHAIKATRIMAYGM